MNFICYRDQDDVWIPAKLEIQMEAFHDSSVVLVHTDQSLIDEKSRVFAASYWNQMCHHDMWVAMHACVPSRIVGLKSRCYCVDSTAET